MSNLYFVCNKNQKFRIFRFSFIFYIPKQLIHFSFWRLLKLLCFKSSFRCQLSVPCSSHTQDTAHSRTAIIPAVSAPSINTVLKSFTGFEISSWSLKQEPGDSQTWLIIKLL